MMDDSSDDDSFVSSDSEISDCGSRDESPSSGFVDDNEESLSVRSDSTIGSVNGKHKKRVTFPTDENLVLIREIPPREAKSDSDTAVESDYDSDEAEYEISSKARYNCTPRIAKGSYEVKKLSGKSVAKIAAITGAKLPTLNDSKKTGKKRSGKRKPKINLSEESDRCKQTEITKPVKQKGSRHRNGKKAKSEGKSNSSSKIKTKLKEENKNTKKQSVQKQDNVQTDLNLSSKQVKIEPTNAIDKNGDDNSINNSDINEAKTVATSRIIGLLDNETEADIVKKIEKVYVIENELLSLSQNYKTPVTKRLDFKSMSKTNRRLYSWLLANGNIPSSQQETPCISPMWDSHGDVKTENGVIKAPT